MDVVFCAYSNIKKRTVVVGWYKNATVLRGREYYNELMYNIFTESKNAVLVPEDERTMYIPRASTDGIGFGQSNIWYANTPESEEIVSRVRNLIYGETGNENIALKNLYEDLSEYCSRHSILIEKSGNSLIFEDCCKIYVLEECYQISNVTAEWKEKTTYLTNKESDKTLYYYVDTYEECIGEVLRILDYKLSRGFETRTSELCKSISVETFELIFKDFLRQADDNAKTGKSNGGTKSKYSDNCFFDGADLHTNYGQGAATKTPHLNWWVLSIYYLPDNGNIIMGIEDYRYPYLNQMQPNTFKNVGNKKDKVAVFYETSKATINYKELYDKFIDVAEQIMRLGVVDYNTSNQ